MSQAQDSEAEKPQFEDAYYVARVSTVDTVCMSWSGIGLAGVAYGMTLVSSYVTIIGVFGLFTAPTREAYLQFFPLGAIGIVIAAVVGFLIAIVAALFVIPTVSLFSYTMGNLWSPITTAGVAGSLCGFVSTVWVCGVLLEASATPIWLIVAYCFGPISAMIFGQVGATRKAVLFVREQLAATAKISSSPFSDDQISKPMQFGVKQLLVLTAWCAGASAISSLIYQSVPHLVIALMTYLFLGPITFPIGKLVMRKWIQRELVRSARIPVRDPSSPSNENVFPKPPQNPFED